MIELYYPDHSIPDMPNLKASEVEERLANSAPVKREEYFPVVESNGMVIARATRSYCHSGSKVLHPVVHLHIIDRTGAIFLQKRSVKKDLQPGKWDTAVGGHVDFGETIVEALFREAREELSLQTFNPVNICSYIFESDRDRELVNVFACVGHPQVKVDPEEIDEGRFWSMQEIDDAIGTGVLTPNFESEYLEIKNDLLALL